MNGAGVQDVIDALHDMDRRASASSLERRQGRAGDWCHQAGGIVEVHIDLRPLVIDPDCRDPITALVEWMEALELESARVCLGLSQAGFTVAQAVSFAEGRAYRAPAKLMVTGSPERTVVSVASRPRAEVVGIRGRRVAA